LLLQALDSTLVSINWDAPYGQSIVYIKIDSANVVSERNESNNQKYTEFLRLDKPDLLLNSIQFSQNEVQQWDILEIEAMVMNTGPITAANVQLRCYDGDPLAGGTEIGSTAQAILLGGETVFLTVPWFVSNATLGQHQIFVVLDPDNIINESIETNNSLSDYVTVIANTISPAIEVDPVGFEISVESGSTLNENLDISNTGGTLLEYALITQLSDPPKLNKGNGFYPQNNKITEITNTLEEIKLNIVEEGIPRLTDLQFNNLKHQAGLYPDDFHKDNLINHENGDGLNNPGNGAGMAGLFDGSGDYVEFSVTESLDITEAITVSAWVYGYDFQQNDIILHKSSAYGIRYDYSASSVDNNEIMFMFYDGGTWRVCDSDFDPDPETWYHFAATYDKNTQECKFYINGNLAKTTSYSQSINIGTNLRMGGWNSGSNDFNGLIDEVRIWNHARNQTEIQSAMYSQLSGNEDGLVGYWTFDYHFLDLSGNGNNGTAYGDATFIESEAPIGTVTYEYASADVPKAVGPSAGAVTESTIDISDEYMIGDVNLTLDLEHTFVSDLSIELISPEGTSIILSSLNGNGGENYQVTTFNDESLTYITDGSAPFDGIYKPFPGLLSLFDAELVTGTWTLRITDNVNGDGGTLNAWSLRIEKFGPAWLLLSPMYGTVAPTFTENNQVSFVSGDMNPGTYYADILINSNDPSHPQYQVPTTTTINGNPEIYFSVDTLEFDVVYLGYSDTLDLTLFNLGNGDAEISEIQFTNSDFSVDNSIFMIPVGESFLVNIAFAPTQTGYVEETLTVVSNDIERQIILTGFGVIKPTISISPASFSAILNTGDTDAQSLIIQNTGGAPLEYNTEARLASDTSIVVGWAFTVPQAGVVQVGSADTVSFTFDAGGLPGDSYIGELWVNNNDPASIKEIAGLDLTVISAPDIEISIDSLVFPNTIFVGVQDTLEVIVSNAGFDTLHISNVVSDNPVFFADPLTVEIPPAGSITLSIIFAPDASSYFSGTLTILNDDEPVHLFAEGYGLMVPLINLSHTEFTQTLNIGESAQQTLTITNNGNSNLEYEAVVDNAPENCLSLDGNGDYLMMPHSGSLDFTGELCIEAWVYPHVVNISQQCISSKGGGWSRSGWMLTLNNNKIRFHLGNGGSEQWFDTQTGISANTWSHIAALWKDGTMNVYINGVIDAYSDSWAQGLVENSYNHFIGRTDGSSTLYFNGEIDEVRVWNYARTQEEIQSSMYTSLTGDEAGLQGYWNFNETNPWQDLSANGNNGQSYGDAHILESGLIIAPSWAEILTNASGTIAPSGSVDVDLQFNAFNIIGGNYEAYLQIINNDPFDPEIEIPLYLTAIGTPAYEMAPNSLDFGTIYFGESADLDFTVTNTGTDTLFVTGINTGNSDFTASPDVFNVVVGSSQVVAVTYLPSAAGSDLGEITLISNAIVSDVVALTGNAINPPVIGVDPVSITDALYIGDKVTRELLIENNGGSDLNYIIPKDNFGDGSDGELSINLGDTYYMDALKSKVDGTNAAGQNTIVINNATGFAVDDEILIISMQDPDTNFASNITGQFETRFITSITDNTFTLEDNLLFTYDQTVEKKHQVIRIPHFTDATVDGTITSDAWDGEVGGIVFFRATGTVTVNSGGKIDASGKGYRGHNRQGDNQDGYQGESIFGIGVQSTVSNMNAGGGGQHAYAGGGGGAYAEFGETGQVGNGGTPGSGGEPIGDPAIPRLYFGGAGGTGGDNDSGQAQNPNGGMGAGIIFLSVYNLSGSGTISSNGGDGNLNAAQDGGAGGGAGGTVWLSSNFNTISLIEAGGGLGFTPVNPEGGKGGNGSVGRIRIDGVYSGAVNPVPYTGEPALPGWITAIPEQGIIPAGESDTVNVTLDATILPVGAHTADLHIYSNDIVNDNVIVPINLTVNPGVGLVVDDTFIIDNVHVDSTKIEPLVIHNVGTETLIISDIVLTDANSVFGISGISFSIPAADQDTLWVTFVPNSAQWFEASIQISSNDPTDPTLDVVLLGNGISDPVIEVSPISFNVVVPQIDSLTETLTINNIGGSDLIYQIESLDALGNGAGMAASFDGNGDYIQIEDNALWDFGTGDF
nr:choice-of-anchor D domain-containing protein [Bacteroidota bacterium]